MSDHDTQPASVPVFSPAPYLESLHVYDALNASLRDANKAALLAVLSDAGITQVVVGFDGYGDSGQIESVEAKAGDASADLPETTVAIADAEWDNPEPVTRTMGIADAIEHVAYEYLGATHAGWENNDGAYGEFVFDVAAGTITLDHNDRYVAVQSYTHAF